MVFRLLAAAATMLALGAPVVDAFNCTCPNGTPTTGAGITGCEADGVDCSACNAGFYISAAAGTGSQKCTACALVGNANSAVTCTTGINSQVTACKDTHTLVQSATAAAADSCKEKGAETYCIKPEVAACNQCCSTKSSFCVKKKCWKCWGGSATTGSANCKACWSNKCMPECQVRSIDHCLPYVELHQVLHLHLFIYVMYVIAAMLQQRASRSRCGGPCRHLRCFRCRPTARSGCLCGGCPLMPRSRDWKTEYTYMYIGMSSDNLAETKSAAYDGRAPPSAGLPPPPLCLGRRPQFM
jgi:hypothetical protein